MTTWRTITVVTVVIALHAARIDNRHAAARLASRPNLGKLTLTVADGRVVRFDQACQFIEACGVVAGQVAVACAIQDAACFAAVGVCVTLKRGQVLAVRVHGGVDLSEFKQAQASFSDAAGDDEL
ncbi:hypothetical protein [Mycobacterium montefiorense]|uniref:hypothetical protein n=1 Tax=Mycobacterium montefiorense TaxID=154654 RepID=UPI002230EC4F|nr:hypothetical protein [Mycobacterium montefiorense]